MPRARDWGKTDYHVIRNWTPRVAQAASDHHTLDHTTPEHTPEPNDIMDQGPVGQVSPVHACTCLYMYMLSTCMYVPVHVQYM